MSILSFLFTAHSVFGAVAGSVATVSSQKVYAYVAAKTAAAKVAVAAAAAKVEAEVKKA
jgi:hypothetical protein